jgi:hypothetical protein
VQSAVGGEHRHFLLVCYLRVAILTFAVLLASPPSSQAQTVDPMSGVLKPVGALHCSATRAEGAATSKLACTLRLMGADADQAKFEGLLYGEGLYLVSPGIIRTLWNVLSPTRRLPIHALEGEYDTKSKHDFAYVRHKQNLLIGGMNDTVVLDLIAPRVDPISPSTRLTLRRIE